MDCQSSNATEDIASGGVWGKMGKSIQDVVILRLKPTMQGIRDCQTGILQVRNRIVTSLDESIEGLVWQSASDLPPSHVVAKE